MSDKVGGVISSNLILYEIFLLIERINFGGK